MRAMLWILAATLPLVLIGCGGQQTPPSGSIPPPTPQPTFKGPTNSNVKGGGS